ncbi:melanocyte-stimulating hormone receptor-like [Pocillopora damicornis]|uniref:melanocyte-stimulating hormone receptor-like n=1 Tax=Pocillopora damicornis TaxID=46731 RepID=UPI000F55866E|nr:melanocyte-stimulating hormone receptor-like [Pocillopora damicornis]
MYKPRVFPVMFPWNIFAFVLRNLLDNPIDCKDAILKQLAASITLKSNCGQISNVAVESDLHFPHSEESKIGSRMKRSVASCQAGSANCVSYTCGGIDHWLPYQTYWGCCKGVIHDQRETYCSERQGVMQCSTVFSAFRCRNEHCIPNSWLCNRVNECQDGSDEIGCDECSKTASFLSVVAVSVDRFLAIHLHLRYQELVTHKRIVIVVISIWVLSASVSFTMFWELRAYINLFILAFGFIISFVAYIKMYLTVRRHKNQIQSLLVVDETQSGIMTNYAAVVKTTVGVLYVYLVLLASYLPHFICMAFVRIYRDSSIAKKQLFLFSLTLMFLNSSLNPVIYCWKMRHIRHAIIDILRNMPRMRNYSSRVNYDRSLSVVRLGN